MEISPRDWTARKRPLSIYKFRYITFIFSVCADTNNSAIFKLHSTLELAFSTIYILDKTHLFKQLIWIFFHYYQLYINIRKENETHSQRN